MKKAVHFGAGNIGRGFIGLLLNLSGYEIVFIDVDQKLVSSINSSDSYQVKEVGGDSEEEYTVDNIRAINGTNINEVAEEIKDANLVTTAVGVSNLKFITPAVVAGIEQRLEACNTDYLNLIACENAVRATSELKEQVYEKLDTAQKKQVEKYIGFPDSAVDRIVPPQDNGGLEVEVEPFSEWIVDKTQIKGPIPDIEGMKLTTNLLAFVERKIFTLNTGHAGTAYLGYHKGYNYIHEAIEDQEIETIVKNALLESGSSLIKLYSFDEEAHKQYINKIIKRFKNKALNNSVIRVGRDPIRKLGPTDRLVKPAMRAFENGTFPSNLCKCIAAGLLFDVGEDKTAKEIQTAIEEQGIETTLTEITGINPKGDVGQEIIKKYYQLQESK
ncbi:mannitol-1-phosphate/altronate dehydrogenase [Halobacteroides halobius DSM 5150]|uniref:Mannitol-1-phosphate 5-dehydrogenase n=1 Tax=Halobacteroides halobius (strain ATCC 35273 / DSM 5150 / MD-1) TaxID=748449 RepID=L0K5M5_HALHC|nr:mannitol-1-phosphate 5-dehydrogenase [Halobacteroides halobius]AGB40291.1 mannitol-1-phosphate/altronate dehydrogenase [Halobacteroides halobius DSM 5150]